jgi:signal-transduction protein with cAMP-binding, CBS, and nucleotidyltransferase domain
MEIEERIKAVEVVALGMDPPVVADASTVLRAVVRRMRDERSGCALLTRDGKLAGIFTERDLVLRVVGVEGGLDQPVSDWMTPNPDRVQQRDPVLTAIRLMRRRGYRNVPVVDEADQVIGCVRHKDIVDYIAEVYPEQVLNLPPDPDQVVLEREGG